MNAVQFLVLISISFFGFGNGREAVVHRKRVKNSQTSNLGIVNGKTASIKKFPYMAAITSPEGSLDGSATILNHHWVVTSAFLATQFDDTVIRVGSKYDYGGKALGIKKTVIYPGYSGSDYNYDIALVKVNETIKFSKTVRPIRLGNKALSNGTKAKISGWGPISPDYYAPSSVADLRKGRVTIADNSNCGEAAQDLICSIDGDITPCGLDFGDPLVIDRKLYGIFAGNDGCFLGTTNYYANITYYHDWILETIKK